MMDSQLPVRGNQVQIPNPFTLIIQFILLPLQVLTNVFSNMTAAGNQPAPVNPNQTRTNFPDFTPMPTRIIEATEYKVSPVETRAAEPVAPPATYENEERVKILWNEDGLPDEIIIHRRATRT